MFDKGFNIFCIASIIVGGVGVFIPPLRILCGIIGVGLGVLGYIKFDPETERMQELSYIGAVLGIGDVILQIVLNIIHFLAR